MTAPKWWDCTLSREEEFKSGEKNPWAKYSTDEIGNWLMEHGVERGVIGEEEGDDGYRHWQIRLVFKKPTEESKVRALIPAGHWTATTVRDFDYVEKEGNFWRSWEGALKKYQTLELYPWQNEVIERAKRQNDRDVIVLVDEQGNSGKTTMAKAITARHLGGYCPPLPEALDYMAWALAHSTSRTFVLDIPKCDDAKKSKAIWSAVEQMKNGYLYDKRHEWREKWIDSPAVVVLTNERPDITCLSYDRWDIGTLEQAGIFGNVCRFIRWDRGH